MHLTVYYRLCLKKTKLLPKRTKDDLRNRPRLFDVIAVNDQIKFIGGGILFVIDLLEKGRLLLVQFTDLLGSLFLEIFMREQVSGSRLD